MQLDCLQILDLRNINNADLALNSRFNIFFGKNGSGKTSLLEAIHVLGTGRSFRASKAGQVITFGKKSAVVSGLVSDGQTSTRLGIERFPTGSPKIRLAEQDCHSIAELARVLPMQLINTESYNILEAAPQVRRQFLDWLMFHVEHSFHETWQRFKRALAQRNAALKNHQDAHIWDKEFVMMGESLNSSRREMLDQFIPIFLKILNNLLKLKGKVSIEYKRGWDEDLDLLSALEQSFRRDNEWGHSTIGPHRMDLEFKWDGVPAKNVLSRGQLKLFVCALFMARAAFLFEKTGRRCIFLIDDLSSELDSEAGNILIETLYKWDGQVLVTVIDSEPLSPFLEEKDYSMFHVEHGIIVPADVSVAI